MQVRLHRTRPLGDATCHRSRIAGTRAVSQVCPTHHPHASPDVQVLQPTTHGQVGDVRGIQIRATSEVHGGEAAAEADVAEEAASEPGAVPGGTQRQGDEWMAMMPCPAPVIACLLQLKD